MPEPSDANPHYDRAPITEAVFELVFAERISESEVEKTKKKLLVNYSYEDAESGILFKLNPVTETTVATPDWKGFKLSSLDRADFSFIRNTAFVVSRLAPYTDWANFNGRMRRDWDIVNGVIGRPSAARLGLRYINRIDVPAPRNTSVNPADYLTILPSMPDLSLGEVGHYIMQVQLVTDDGDFLVSINTGKMDSPLIGYKSFLLDIDIIRQKDVPTMSEEIWAMAERMRKHKNLVFNGCVTERAKDLFR